MSHALATRSTAPDRHTQSGSGFFTDVEGLRGIAVTIVVLFHASVPHMAGGFVGVDLFFVISGFLITGLLLREYERSGKISFKGFFARRARRIIPPAAVVIVVTAAAVWLVLPLLSIFRQAFDLLAAAVNIANWRFIAQNKDYLAGGADDSVATHFWSLSVEEQFYLVWPFLVVLLAVAARRMGWSVRLVVGIGITAVSLGSFAASLRLTVSDPVLSYMATHTRVWQFGMGAVVAVAAPYLLKLRTVRWVVVLVGVSGWVGLCAVIFATVQFDDHTAYPGWAAVVPTLGGGAMILAGQLSGVGMPTVGAFLAMGWLRWIGKVSYSWYLWHWPVVIIVKEITGTTEWRVLVVAMVGALGVAWLSTTLIENPLMTSRELRRNLMASVAVGMTATVAATVATMSLGVMSVKMASATVSDGDAVVSFEEVFGVDSAVSSGAVTPNPFQAYEDRPPRDDCLVQQTENRTPDTCVFGAERGTPVVLFGDSHAEQWFPMAEVLAEENNWTLYQFTKAACPAPNLQARDGRTDHFAKPVCRQWRQDSIKRIQQIRPEYIIVSSLSIYLPDYQELKVAWEDTLSELRPTGAQLLYIRDTPYPNFHVPECISGSMDDWAQCDFDLENMRKIEPIVTDQVRGENTDILIFDFNPFLCTQKLCHSVRNSILLYRDNSHLTQTAAELFTHAFRQMLLAKGVPVRTG